MTFSHLLELCPPEIRENIHFFATDSTGHRSAYFEKPIAIDGHWHTDQPYHWLDMDIEGAKHWEKSLIRRPPRTAANSEDAGAEKNKKTPPKLLLAANWDSGVGYAWWLMESFWQQIGMNYECLLAYPSISKVPKAVSEIPLITHDFTKTDIKSVFDQCVFLKRHQISTIYFTDQADWHWRYAAFRLAGVKRIIVHDHTPGIRSRPPKPKLLLKQFIQRLPWLPADAVFAVSSFVRKRTQEVSGVPPQRCHVIQNGIPEYSPQMPVDPYEEFGIPRHRQIIVTVSRATKYKGIHHALTYLSGLPHRNWHYLTIGDGPDLDEFKQLSEHLDIANNVTFAGRRSDVKDILVNCHVGLHPSSGEASSLAVLELMQARLPVILPDNPSMTEPILPDAGIAYKTPDEAMLAINRLLDPDEAKKLGEVAAHRVKTRYSLRNTHRDLIKAMSLVVR